MPYVNIKVTREGVTQEQKAQLIAGATQLLFDVLGKPHKATFVVIDEVDTFRPRTDGAQVRIESQDGSAMVPQVQER